MTPVPGPSSPPRLLRSFSAILAGAVVRGADRSSITVVGRLIDCIAKSESTVLGEILDRRRDSS
jgi:hypothetical protein